MIDSASFPSAEMAVARSEPVLQLMTVVEHEGDDAFLEAMVPRVLEESIVDVALSAEVQSRFKPLQESRETFNRLVKERSKEAHDVVVVDLGSEDIEVAGKFVTYALYPRSLYSVVLTRSPSKCKVSVGYNPWSQKPRLHNIAAICERYGGGGHPVVGAVSVPASELERARAIVAEIVDELARPPVSAQRPRWPCGSGPPGEGTSARTHSKLLIVRLTAATRRHNGAAVISCATSG